MGYNSVSDIIGLSSFV